MTPPAADTSGGRTSRQHLLERALLAVGAVALGATVGSELTADAASGPSRKQDVRILNFLLLLERLQAGLYAAASSHSSIHGELRRLARVAGAHEREHVRLIERALGSAADAKPSLRFDQAVSTPRRFVRAALRLEETATAATIGEAANLTRGHVLDAARIVSVDARHAAWLRDIARELPAPRAADPSQSAGEVARFIRGAGYVVRG